MTYKGNQYDTPEFIAEVKRDYLQQLATGAEKAVLVLVRLLDDYDPKIRLAAANSLLDRAFGKANQSIIVSGSNERSEEQDTARAAAATIRALVGAKE